MKTIIRESIAMIILVMAILIITVLVFFDSIKAESNQPQAAKYRVSKEEQNILEAKKEYEEQKNTTVLTATYSVDNEVLANHKAKKEFSQGQSSPFDEIVITDILHDKAGNAYYQVRSEENKIDNTLNSNNSNNKGNSNTNSNSTNNSNNSNNNSTNNNNNNNQKDPNDSDISTSSPGSGSIQGPVSGK